MYFTDILPGFNCRRCARCCKEKVIPIFQMDIKRLQPHVTEEFYEPTNRWERQITGARYKMRLKTKQCIFLTDGVCKHYDLRPNTCRRHPFLVTQKYFLVSSTCPGINWNADQGSDPYRKLSKEIAKSIDLYVNRVVNRGNDCGE